MVCAKIPKFVDRQASEKLLKNDIVPPHLNRFFGPYLAVGSGCFGGVFLA
jgi:hypothetical protein